MAKKRKKRSGNSPNGVERPVEPRAPGNADAGLPGTEQQGEAPQSEQSPSEPEFSSPNKKLESETNRLSAATEEVVASGDVEEAAVLRDQAENLKTTENSINHELRTESIDLLRSRVQDSLSDLVDREHGTRDRLKDLDVRLQPLLKTIRKVAERADLKGQDMMRLRAQAEERAHAAAKRLTDLVRETERSHTKCDELLLSVARQCRRFQAVVGSRASEFQESVVQATHEIEELRCSILEWVQTKEEQYFGAVRTGDALADSRNAERKDAVASAPEAEGKEAGQ